MAVTVARCGDVASTNSTLGLPSNASGLNSSNKTKAKANPAVIASVAKEIRLRKRIVCEFLGYLEFIGGSNLNLKYGGSGWFC